MSSLLMAMLAGAGVHLLATSSPRNRPDSTGTDRNGSDRANGSASPSTIVQRWRVRLRLVLDQAGLHGVAPWQFVVTSLGVGACVGTLTAAVFGVGLPVLMVAAAATMVPALLWRRRRPQSPRGETTVR